MITLKEAVEQNRIDRFIAEHPDMKGDEAAFNRVVEAMARTSKEARPASPKAGSDD